jgi:hypothetical protein
LRWWNVYLRIINACWQAGGLPASLGAVKLSRFKIQRVKALAALKRSGLEVVERAETMAISQDLLEILACPACKARVELKPDESGLKCEECKRVYPVRDDIPVMLIDEATIEDEELSRKA